MPLLNQVISLCQKDFSLFTLKDDRPGPSPRQYKTVPAAVAKDAVLTKSCEPVVPIGLPSLTVKLLKYLLVFMNSFSPDKRPPPPVMTIL